MEYLDKAEFQEKMQEKTAAIEAILQETLPKGDSLQRTIFHAMDYSVMGGGKRIRPMLLGEAYRLFTEEEDEMVAVFMTALEMIHTYSLVHDDLPAMDNDDYRRGRETTHKVFGEDMGILAGDALLNYAYETAVQGVANAKHGERAVAALLVLAKKAGVYGMVGGQVVDVEMTGKPLRAEQVEFIYCLKTGALLEASLLIGAILSGADQAALARMEEIGRLVGLAFQIQDDILDVTGNTEELGKPAHSDEKNAKTTFVSLHGLEASAKAVKEYSDRALEILDSLPGQNPYLNTLIRMLTNRKK